LKRSKGIIVSAAILAFALGVSAQEKSPLKLLQSIPLPELHDGDFDHLTPDVQGNRLFVTAEENSKVLVFDLKTNKLIHTIDDVKAPHSMLYRPDLKSSLSSIAIWAKSRSTKRIPISRSEPSRFARARTRVDTILPRSTFMW